MTFCQMGKQDEFGNASGTRGEVLGNPLEVIMGLVYSLAEVQTGLALGRDCILKVPTHVVCI